MGSINALGDFEKREEREIAIGWERNKLYIHLAARNNPGTFHWSLYLTEEKPERGWVYHVFDPVPDRWVLEMLGGDGEEERVKEKRNRDSSEESESPGQESGGDGDQPVVGPEGESKEGPEDKTESKKCEDKRKRESEDTGHSSDEMSDEDGQLESDRIVNVKEKEVDRKRKRNKTDNEENQEKNDGVQNLEDSRNSKSHDTKDNNYTFVASSSLLAAIEIGTDIQDMREIIEETISTEWTTGRKKIAKGEKICREFLLKCVEELESVGVLSFRDGKGIGDVEREAEEFGLLSDPALNVGARRGRVWKSRVVE